MLAFAILGLAGCAIALAALAFDWRETVSGRIAYWTVNATGDDWRRAGDDKP